MSPCVETGDRAGDGLGMTDPRPSVTRLQRDIDRVDAAQNKHEAECALRYGQLNDKLDSFKETLDSNNRRSGRVEIAAWGLLVSILTILIGMWLRGEIA